MELHVLGVNLGFENPSVIIEEGGVNIEDVLQDITSNEEARQSEGLTSTYNEVMPRF